MSTQSQGPPGGGPPGGGPSGGGPPDGGPPGGGPSGGGPSDGGPSEGEPSRDDSKTADPNAVHWPDPATSSSTRDLRSDFSAWLTGRAGESTDVSPLDLDAETARIPRAVEEVYEDRGEIGRGGMGTVHRVFDRRLLRESALKIQRTEVGRYLRETRRFVEEAQIMGQLDHPNIVPIHDLGQDARGAHFFTMKLVQGETLEETVERLGDGRLEADALADLLDVFIKVCDAVAFSHSRGVIHRDIKPANIMVGEYGQVYLMDWGIARLADAAPDPAKPPRGGDRRRVVVDRKDTMELDAPGSIVGTPRYMSPEQVQGDHERTDHRVDIFALGGVLYYVLAGHPPYTEENYFSLLVQVQNCEIARPSSAADGDRIPGELERIEMRAMAPEPEDRYPSVGALKRDVERFLRGVSHLPIESFAPGQAIVTEGDEGSAAYIIRRGTCRVIKGFGRHRKEVRLMGPGDVFGETAIFAASKRSASVEAVDDVEVTVVTSELLNRGLGLSSWMGEFVRALATRFRELDERLHAEPPEEK
ncbi:MAG: serine/threonine-protein kinase [Acidobacteriota bacterium]